MATIREVFEFSEADLGEGAAWAASLKHQQVQQEGHASSRSTRRDGQGRMVRTLTVLEGRPKGWYDEYGDVDRFASAKDREHFGLRPYGADPDPWLPDEEAGAPDPDPFLSH
jgi:hypothetical protein